MDLSQLDRWASAHHGVISRQRAMELGVSSAAWYRAIRRGQLELVHPGVARLLGTPRTAEQAIMAAVVAAGPRAIASHRSGAVLWGVEWPASDPVDLILPRSARLRKLANVEIHRPTDVGDLTPVTRSAIRCTNLLRTLVDLGAVADGGVEAAVEAAIASGAVTPRVLRALVERHARPGRAGVVALRRALEAWPVTDKPPDSLLEVRMRRFIERFGLPAVEFHAWIAGREVDFRVIDTPLVLECDGWEFHARTREQHDRDVLRDQHLAAAGFVVVHFTWRQITRDAARTAARLRALLERWAPHVLV